MQVSYVSRFKFLRGVIKVTIMNIYMLSIYVNYIYVRQLLFAGKKECGESNVKT